MKTTLLLLASVVLGATWAWEKMSAARLAIEFDAQRAEHRELAALQREHARLRTMQATDEELARLRRAATAHTQLQQALAEREAAPAQPRPALPVGEWTPMSELKNRGQLTPHAAVETALWAAAGGDVTSLKKLLSLDDATRTQAGALLARLPANARAAYASAEDLIAAFTIKNIPVGEAQLVWFNARGEDDATACVFLQRPLKEGENLVTAPARPEAAPALTREEAVRIALERQAQRAANRDREPPRAPENQTTSKTYLSLHRYADGWRLIVPVQAVEKIARELGAAPAP